MGKWTCLLVVGVAMLVSGPSVARADYIYTTKSSSSTISQYSMSGTFLTSHATGGNMNTVTFDAAGNVYTTDLGGGVTKFIGGSVNSSVDLPTTGTLPWYYGTAADASGNVYFSTDADTGPSSDIKIYRYLSGTGNPVLFSDTGTNTSFSVRNSVAVDPVSQNVFLADYSNNQIIEYNPAGVAIHTFTSGISGPWGIAIDSLGDLYVSNVVGTSSLVKIVISSGTPTNVATGLSGPAGVAVDSLNNVYELAESSVGGVHGAVFEYSPTGTALGEVVNTGPSVADYITVTPEPGTCGLLGLGALGLVARRRGA